LRYAIISDIHSNYESFKTFLNILPSISVEKIICLGDIVGYNPNPNECIEVLSKLKYFDGIRGNHDRALVEKNYNDFSYEANFAIKWAIKNIKPDNLIFLKNLGKGPKLIDNKFMICHGSINDEDQYITSIFQTHEEFRWLFKNNIHLCFFGHTHYQKIYQLNTKKEAIFEIGDKEIQIEKNNFYLINPGSLGQPRDGDRRASFAIFDSDLMSIKIIRYDYPYEITKQKITDLNFPKFLAERLESGI